MMSIIRAGLACGAMLLAVAGQKPLLGQGEAASSGQVNYRVAEVHDGLGQVFKPGLISIKDGKIVSIGKAEPRGSDDSSKGVVHNLGRAVIVPGFVESVSWAGLPRGTGANEEGREVTPSLAVADCLDAQSDELTKLRRQGVTSVLLHPGSRNVVGGLVALVKPVGSHQGDAVVDRAVALRITLGGDPARGHGRRAVGLLNRRPQSRMGTVWVVRRALNAALAYRDAKGEAQPAKPDPDMEVLVQALEGKIPVVWQARSQAEVRTALRLSEEFGIKRQVILEGHEADDVAKELEAANIPVVLGPLFYPQYRSRRFGPRRNPSIDEDLGPYTEIALEGEDVGGHGHDHQHDHNHGETAVEDPALAWTEEFSPVKDPHHDCCSVNAPPAPDEPHHPTMTIGRLLKSKVKCALGRGSDRDGDTLLDFARTAYRHGVDEKRALAMITSIPAEIMGVADHAGSLKVGRSADFVILSGHPMRPTSSIQRVVINGSVQYDADKE